MARRNSVRGAGFLVALAALAVVVLLSISVGAREIPLTVVWDALFDHADIDDHHVVRGLRLPRTVVGLVVGAALGIAGALTQALTRNPLADPGILGVNAGAALFVALGIGVFGVGSVSGYLWFAFAGALMVTVAVYLIGSAGRGPADPVRLVLAGVALGAVVSGITTGLVLLDPQTFDQMRNWNAGSFVGRDLDVVWPVLPFLAAGLLLAMVSARPLNAIGLGEDMASSLGANVTRTRVIVVIAVTLLAGGATAIAGPIGFVGLMMPHVARWIVGPDQRWILPYTVVLAPILLLSADILGRVLMRPGEVPVGIVTAFVGAPVLIILIRRKKASGL
ncbi:iron chelate uptake ABC transporter family permease subunit [Phytoactinopolyspora endophytica]|uniref:FecCD family ABC transporter permease n=1 Tax=Phytoactinopolyspora endophytica TaxID=1642495 RepID=UPI0013EDF221